MKKYVELSECFVVSHRCSVSAATWLVALAVALFTLSTAPRLAHATVPEHIVDAIEAARDHNIDPQVFLAIGWRESRLDPNMGQPMQKGKPMSSAVGMWQILSAQDTLSELGLGKQERKDYARATPALAAYFERQKERLKDLGFDPTPGKLYMTWNVGPGMAAAILNAKPFERIEAIARRALRKYGRKFIAQWLRNNPSMYKKGMTATEVAANYEVQMKKDMKAVERFLEPQQQHQADASS